MANHTGWGGTWGGHSNPDYQMLLEMGTDGLRDRIAGNRLRLRGRLFNNLRYHIGRINVKRDQDGNITDVSFQPVSELPEKPEEQQLDFIGLMVTDAVREISELLVVGNKELLRQIPYERHENGLFYLPGVLSRKKQLLPQMLTITLPN